MNHSSIIIPVYKVEPYLKKCIDSILGQTFTNFDLILIDDGSPDNCGRICDEYAKRDNRIKVIHQRNSGLSAARNAGIDWAIDKSNSNYITFIDSDDWVEPNYLEELLIGIQDSDGVSCTSCALIDKEGKREIRLSDRGWHTMSPEEYWTDSTCLSVISCGKLYAKELFKSVRFPIGKIHEDAFTTHRLLFQCEKIAVRHIPTYNYLSRNDSIMGSDWSPKRLDAFDAYLNQCAYFKLHGFTKAYTQIDATILGMIVSEVGKVEAYKPEMAQRLRDYLHMRTTGSRLPFWPYRGYYRTIGIRFFWIKWFFWMAIDALRNGRNSWLLRDSVPILKSLVKG